MRGAVFLLSPAMAWGICIVDALLGHRVLVEARRVSSRAFYGSEYTSGVSLIMDALLGHRAFRLLEYTSGVSMVVPQAPISFDIISSFIFVIHSWIRTTVR